ncbi:MAG: endonuclease/exonuclease/phosphatase family protein, partial [Actinomycetales bacterium]
YFYLYVYLYLYLFIILLLGFGVYVYFCFNLHISVFADSTHVTPDERARLRRLREQGLVDVMPRAQKGNPYTFWDYRNGALHRGWGMRIDLVYANAAFADVVTDAYVDREARKGKGASDHAPVVVDLDLPARSDPAG